MRTCLLVLAILASQPSQAVDITNFRSGLACTNTRLTDDGTGWICQPTEDVLVTDQGTCVFNGAQEKCTWVGFEFDYSNAIEGEKLQCVSEASLPMEIGNPRERIAVDATSHDYELELGSKTGHFFNPQYFIFAARKPGNSTIVEQERCSSAGKVLFEYKFNIRYPIVPDGQG